MKKIFLLTSVLCLFTLLGCEKDEETKGASRTTYYVDLALKGELAMSIPVGGTYVDPGYTCTENGVAVPVTVTGTVDASTPGVYSITYSAENADGYEKSFTRLVGVITPSAAVNDLSGNYKRSTGAPVTWTKVADGVYLNDNVGGIAAPGKLYAYVFNIDAYIIVVPKQETAAGSLYCIEAVYTPSPAGYQWKVINGGYGNALRTFVKI